MDSEIQVIVKLENVCKNYQQKQPFHTAPAPTVIQFTTSSAASPLHNRLASPSPRAYTVTPLFTGAGQTCWP